MTSGYTHLDEKPFESYYLLVEGLIDHPVEKVWPHAVKIGSWMTSQRLETVTGESGKVGHFERVFLRDERGQDVASSHDHVYGVANIIPFKYIALEVFADRDAPHYPRQWITHEGILLTDLGGRTKIALHLVSFSMGKGDREAFERRRKKIADSEPLVQQYFENLRQLIEKAG